MIATLAARPQARRRRQNVTWESRSAARRPRAALRSARVGAGPRLFALGAAVLGAAFLTALLYLRFATSIAATGYDMHALDARREELRRENQLLELQLQRLDAPARVEAAAQRLGLVKAARTLYLNSGPLTLR